MPKMTWNGGTKTLAGVAALIITLTSVWFAFAQPRVSREIADQVDREMAVVDKRLDQNMADHKTIEDRLGKQLDEIKEGQREMNRKLDRLLMGGPKTQ